MGRLSNITIDLFRSFLKSEGLTLIRTTGGHEIWGKPGLTRPIVIQTHVDPIPEFIIINNLRSLGITRKSFESFISGKRA